MRKIILSIYLFALCKFFHKKIRRDSKSSEFEFSLVYWRWQTLVCYLF